MRVELLDIQKHFGPVHANDGVSLLVESGTIHGLLGENGAGKTTLMKILSGYQPYDSGTIQLDGHAVRFSSPAEALRAGIGMLHQDPLDVPALSVLDNFLFGREERLVQQRRAGRQQLLELCQRFGFSLDPDTTTGSLTIGERQQLELVRLLSLGVRLIILDEPTTGISAPQKMQLFATLHRLAAEGLSVILVSHKLDDVVALCSQATVLRQGKVAGHAMAPFILNQLVHMMFAQELSPTARAVVPLGEVVLALEDLCIHTYRLSVEHINLQVCRGEVIGLAGLEGSGQRLLMQACAGLQRITSGRLMIAGVDMSRQPYARFLEMGVAFVPAARLEEGMVPGLTLCDHCALSEGRREFFVRWPRAIALAERLIHEFNIAGRPETPVEDLSGGNQQRALLALQPEDVRVLIIEHPTRGLDVEATRWVWNKLLQRRAQGTAILFTSTDLDELVEHSDRIVVFSGGVMSAPVPAVHITREALGALIGGRQK
jgi:general nucleoside transport system ATP-binding protein